MSRGMDEHPTKRRGPFGVLATMYRAGPVSFVIALIVTILLLSRFALEFLPTLIRAVDRQ